MTTSDVPADLIKLRRAFLAAEHEHKALADQWPSSMDMVSGAEVDEELRARTDKAHARMQDAAVSIQTHGWWATAGNRADAEKALRAASDGV